MLLITFSFERKNTAKVNIFSCICFLEEKELPKNAFISLSRSHADLWKEPIPQQSKCKGSVSQIQVTTDTNIVMKQRL